MIVAFPVTSDQGLDSPLSPHFGRAPFLMLVDTAAASCRVLPRAGGEHGTCAPLAGLLEGNRPDCMVVRGLGRGALARLDAAGIPVLLSREETVRASLLALEAGGLPKVAAENACAGHSHEHGDDHGGGCGHHA